MHSFYSRPVRRAFRTRRKAYEQALESAGVEEVSTLSKNKKHKVRQQARRYLYEHDMKGRVLVYVVFVLLIAFGVALSMWIF